MPTPPKQYLFLKSDYSAKREEITVRELPNPTAVDPSIQVVAMVLREGLQRGRIYVDVFEFVCSICGSPPDEWGFGECMARRTQ
jgi:hypothetical protein